MAKIVTYVSSYTYDELLGIMYPDDVAKERALEEVERLIVQGHTIEHRFGDNMATVLDLEKFNTYVKPNYSDEEIAPVEVQEVMLQNELNNLVPDTNLTPEITPVVESPAEVVAEKEDEVISLVQPVVNVAPSVVPEEQPKKESKPVNVEPNKEEETKVEEPVEEVKEEPKEEKVTNKKKYKKVEPSVPENTEEKSE